MQGGKIVVSIDERPTKIRRVLKSQHRAYVHISHPKRILVLSHIPFPIVPWRALTALEAQTHRVAGYLRMPWHDKTHIIEGDLAGCGMIERHAQLEIAIEL